MQIHINTGSSARLSRLETVVVRNVVITLHSFLLIGNLVTTRPSLIQQQIYPEVHPPPSYSELPPSQQQVSHGRYGQPPPPHNYNVPLPVVQQPCNPTTVVVNQPLLQQTRLWSSGTCDCTDDPGICESVTHAFVTKIPENVNKIQAH